MMKLSLSIQKQLWALSQQVYPNEYCALLWQTAEGKLELLPCQNVADDPKTCFEIDPMDFVKANQLGKVVAVVHNHPNGERFLSTADRLGQLATGLPYALLSGGVCRVFEPVAHLLGRPFVFGQYDCGQLIADAYHLAGLGVFDVPHQTEQGDLPERALTDCLQQAGFECVLDGDYRAGDVLLCASHRQLDHAMLYLGNDWVLHHTVGGLSRRERYRAFWQKQLRGVWRFPAWRDECLTALSNDFACGDGQ